MFCSSLFCSLSSITVSASAAAHAWKTVSSLFQIRLTSLFFFNCLFCVFCLCELPCVGDISMLYVQDTAVSLCDCRVAGCSLSSFAAVKATSTCCSMLSCRTVPLPDFTALMIREMFKPFRCSMQAFQNALAS